MIFRGSSLEINFKLHPLQFSNRKHIDGKLNMIKYLCSTKQDIRSSLCNLYLSHNTVQTNIYSKIMKIMKSFVNLGNEQMSQVPRGRARRGHKPEYFWPVHFVMWEDMVGIVKRGHIWCGWYWFKSDGNKSFMGHGKLRWKVGLDR